VPRCRSSAGSWPVHQWAVSSSVAARTADEPGSARL
jgi:hypothetical protein